MTCDDSSDGRSVTTTEAMAEMLGLPISYFDVASSSSSFDDDDDDDDGGGPDPHDRDENDDDENAGREPKYSSRFDGTGAVEMGSGGAVVVVGAGGAATLSSSPPPHPRVSSLVVPRRCSRYNHHPHDVTAFAIHDFLNIDECRSLIRLASAPSAPSTSSDSAFRYVREAIHVDDAGTSHLVSLVRGTNRHKLSVFEHEYTVRELWKRMDSIISSHVVSLTKFVNCGKPVGLNPRLRVLRYDAKDHDVFDAHFDATTRVTGMGVRRETTTTTKTDRDDVDVDIGTTGDRSSLLTVLIYLNDGGGMDFDGGETRFVNRDYDDRPNHRRHRYGIGGTDGGTNAPSSSRREWETIVTPEAGKVVVFEHDLYHMSSPLVCGTKYVLRTDVLFDVESIDNVGRTRIRRVDDDPSSSTSANVDDGMANATTTNANATTTMPRTLLDACRRLSLAEDDVRGLDEIGLLHTTMDALLAPGVRAVREVLSDVVDGRIAECIIRAALESRRDDCGGR